MFEFVCVVVLCALSITIKNYHTHISVLKEYNNFVFRIIHVQLLCIMIIWSEIITAIIIMCFVDNLPLIWILVLKNIKKQ